MIIKGTKENFKHEVLESKEPVIVDFWAIWCQPCQRLNPILESIVETTSNIKVVKVNVDEEMDIADTYGIMTIPTIVIFKDGKIFETLIGIHSKESILAKAQL